MEFNTTEYQFSHGKQPKGFGHWAFAPVAPRCAEHAVPQFFTGTYSQAKAQASKHYRLLAYSRVNVLG